MSTSLLEPQNALQVFKGESKTLKLTILQPDPDNPGGCIPLDISGSTLYFTVKERADSPEVLIRKTSVSLVEIELSDPRAGIARIFLIPSDTSGLSTIKSYVFDIWIVLSSGERHTVVKVSTFRVLQGVTTI